MVKDFSVKSDKSGYEFRYEGVLSVAQVDTGNDNADFENFIRDLPRLDAEYPGWVISFPERYRGQNGHYEDGARFLTTTRPDGQETTLEFTWVRCPWRLARGLESRYEKGKRKLRVESDASQGKDGKRQRKYTRQRKGQKRSRRNSQIS